MHLLKKALTRICISIEGAHKAGGMEGGSAGKVCGAGTWSGPPSRLPPPVASRTESSSTPPHYQAAARWGCAHRHTQFLQVILPLIQFPDGHELFERQPPDVSVHRIGSTSMFLSLRPDVGGTIIRCSATLICCKSLSLCNHLSVTTQRLERLDTCHHHTGVFCLCIKLEAGWPSTRVQ
jgi:hypothetical protein